MKALVLSLVIAFSSSFAFGACTLAEGAFNSNEGKLTRAVKQTPALSGQVASTKGANNSDN